MKVLFGKITRIIITIILVLVEVANIFLGNILVYNTTDKFKFDWLRLLRSPIFWIVLILTIVYNTIPLIINQNNQKVDENVEKAISDNSVKLIDLATENAVNGNFESAKKALKVLDKVQKRRHK